MSTATPLRRAAVEIIDADTDALVAQTKAAVVRKQWPDIIVETARNMDTDDLDDLRARCQEAGLTHRSTWTRALTALAGSGRMAVEGGKFWLL